MQTNPTSPPSAPNRMASRFPFYYGWVIVGVVALAHFTESAEIFPVIGVLLKPMTAEFGWSRTSFTAATSIGTLAGGFAGPLVGPYVDKFGARMILSVSFTLLGVTMVAMAFITELWQFYAIQIIARFLALGVISLALSIMIPKWFVVKRARAIAFSGLGGRLGNAITPIYVLYLVTVYNWRVATVTTGIVMLALTLLPVALFVRRQPEDMGLLPDGVLPEEQARIAADAKASGKSMVQEVSFTFRQVAMMPAFYYLLGAQLFGSMIGPALNLHMIPYFTDKGLSPTVAVAATTTLFISSALGSVIFGFLSERFGIKRVITVDYVFMGLGFVFLLMVTDSTGAILWGLYMGIVQGGGMTLNQILFADYFGRASLGSIRGAITPATLATNAIGPLAAAWAYDALGNYFLVFAAFGFFRVVSGLLVLLAKAPVGSAAELAERGRATVAP